MTSLWFCYCEILNQFRCLSCLIAESKNVREGVYTWNFIPGWNHPCLWSNVSYYLHVFAEMKFHPRMKDRDEISHWDEEKKKRRVNTSSRDEILKWACFFNFWRTYSSMFSKFNMFEHNESLNIMKNVRPLCKKWSPKRKEISTTNKK